ncbi:MAG: alpha/beta fold hydrolase [Fimbriimonadales bacterium]
MIFVHGSNADSTVFDKSFISAVKQTFGATGHVMFDWSGTMSYNVMENDARKFCEFVKQVKEKHPLEPVIVVAHSNGGNVATLAASLGAPINTIIRLGSPTPNRFQNPNWTKVPNNVTVFNFYDPNDAVVNNSFVAGGGPAENAPFINIAICGDPNNRLPQSDPRAIHSNLRSAEVWNSQVAPYLSPFDWSNPAFTPWPKFPW